jgi:hypothetical protein
MISPKTRERYSEIAANQIVPYVGGIKITAIRKDHVRKWHADLEAKGFSPRTIRHTELASSMITLNLGFPFCCVSDKESTACFSAKESLATSSVARGFRHGWRIFGTCTWSGIASCNQHQLMERPNLLACSREWSLLEPR